MNMIKLHERLCDATARLDAVLCIAGMVVDGALADPLRDLLEQDNATLKRCFPDLPKWVEESLDDEHTAADAFADWFVVFGKLGFVLKVATPVMRHSSSTISSYSWSHYSFAWVYGDTLDAAVRNALAWVAERRDAERQKAGFSTPRKPPKARAPAASAATRGIAP